MKQDNFLSGNALRSKGQHGGEGVALRRAYRSGWLCFLLTVAGMAAALPGTDRISTAQEAVAAVAAPSLSKSRATQPGTPRQQQWRSATPEQRVRMAEAIGEEGARHFAKARGWEPILDGTQKTLPQGLDQVYRGADGTVHVVEAKGGDSQTGHAYGHRQGSSAWAVEAAKRTLRSTKASSPEKRAAQTVLEAAAGGQLQVHVLSTGHVLGEPTATVLRQTERVSEEVARAARAAMDDLVRASGGSVEGAARSVPQAAGASARGAALKVVVKGTAVAGLTVDAAVHIRDALEIERQYAAGAISPQEREMAHARNVAGMTGGWAGAAAGAKLGAASGGTVGSFIAPGPGSAIGGVVGAVGGAIAGYFGGHAAGEAAAAWAVDKFHALDTSSGNADKAATGNHR